MISSVIPPSSLAMIKFFVVPSNRKVSYRNRLQNHSGSAEFLDLGVKHRNANLSWWPSSKVAHVILLFLVSIYMIINKKYSLNISVIEFVNVI